MNRIAVGVLVVGLTLTGCGLGAWYLGSSARSRIQRINEANPKLQAAVRQAQKELPAFLRELSAPKPGQGFAIRAKFDTPSGPEYLWIRNPAASERDFHGILDQEPIAAREYRKGQEVKVKRADIVDWLIVDPDGKQRGAYTERALMSRGVHLTPPRNVA